MVKNHKLAKSISDAAWSQFAQWLQYFGKVYGKIVIAVAPEYTSQDCSACGNTVKKTLSTRTHICGCGAVLDRDHNAGRNILAKGFKQAGITLNTVGRTEINAWGQNDLYYLVVTSTSKSTD
jgi:putative transposase